MYLEETGCNIASMANLQVGVGLASFSMRRAASFASVPFRAPLRAAQRRYFPVGRQLFLYPDVVTTSAPGGHSQGLSCWALGLPIAADCKQHILIINSMTVHSYPAWEGLVIREMFECCQSCDWNWLFLAYSACTLR